MPRPVDFPDDVPTRPEAPLPTRYEPATRQLLLLLDEDGEVEPAERPGTVRA